METELWLDSKAYHAYSKTLINKNDTPQSFEIQKTFIKYAHPEGVGEKIFVKLNRTTSKSGSNSLMKRTEAVICEEKVLRFIEKNQPVNILQIKTSLHLDIKIASKCISSLRKAGLILLSYKSKKLNHYSSFKRKGNLYEI